MVSVIVPAHNEETVIARCLATLLDGTGSGEFEVIVSCNGCADGTASIARAFAGVQVIESTAASKAAALNAADQVASRFPRVYLDADVELSAPALRGLVAEMERRDLLAASTNHRFDMAGVPWLVRRYYEFWSRLPTVQEGLLGSGVYALSAAGWARLEGFPDLIADDAFVHHAFAPSERGIIRTEGFLVRPPRTAMALIRRKVRVFSGNRQLHRQLGAATTTDRRGWLTVVRTHPASLLALPSFLLVSIAAKSVATVQERRGGSQPWNQDRTSRGR